MKLILIYGKPAVGKLTVARELSRLTGWRLFHNHLAVNLALSLHEFGSPGFIELREKVWTNAFASALSHRLTHLIFTFNPENSVPQRFIDELFAQVAAHGGEVVPVELTAPETEIERRIGSDSRHGDGKLTSVDLYRQLRDKGAFGSPVLPAPRLALDTSKNDPAGCARRIAALLA